MSKEQLEASLKTFEMLLQVFGFVLAIATLCVAVFGLKAWLLSNQLKNLQHIEDLQTQSEIARLNKDAADTKERTAKTELEIEKEKSARLALEKNVGPRTFNSEQEGKLQAELQKYSIHSVDLFGWANGDTESKEFTKKLKALLEKSGWHPHTFWLADVDNPISGVRVEFDWATARTQPLTSALMGLDKALLSVGIHVSGPIPIGFFAGSPRIGAYGPETAGDKPESSIRIFIGKRW